MHVPYPDSALYSNKAHVVYHAYKIGDFWRLNATFTEASEMAGFLTVALGLLGWELFTRPLRLKRCLSFVLIMVSILFTFSSTGYLVVAFMLLLSGILYVRYLMRRGGIAASKLIVAIIVVSAGLALTTNTSARETVTEVVGSVLLDKDKSASYRDRTESHAEALATLSDTYYMGAGWGSIRASGLGYVLLGTVGVIGLALFISFYCSLFIPIFRRRRPNEHKLHGDLFDQSLFGVTILLCGMAVSGAEPTLPTLWVLFGIATAGRTTSSTSGLPGGCCASLSETEAGSRGVGYGTREIACT
jgi:hypothetical protein